MPSAEPEDDSPDELAPDDVAELLIHGSLDIVGRLSDASNMTLLAKASYNGVTAHCVYKPIRGERPLWDFPDGSLAGREVAAALIAHEAGWNCVPPTFLRDGPMGTGMIQRWIDGTNSESMVNLFATKKLPAGWLPVLRASDAYGSPAILAHADDDRLKLLATFDLVVNNADRKGPHVLPVPDGAVYGVDHGLTLHRDNKLRTVLWGWAGDPLPAAGIEGLALLAAGLEGEFGELLAELLTVAEVEALQNRITRLRRKPVFDKPPEHRTAIPWPPL